MSTASGEQLLERIKTSRNLAEELLREMPDMKEEIEMELKDTLPDNFDAAVVDGEEGTDAEMADMSEQSENAKYGDCVVECHGSNARKRESDEKEDMEPVRLCGPASKQIKIDSTLEERKSIIEACISNKAAKNDAAALYELERIRKLKEQTIIALDQLKRQEEKLLRAEAIAKQLKMIAEEEREEPKKANIKLEMLESNIRPKEQVDKCEKVEPKEQEKCIAKPERESSPTSAGIEIETRAQQNNEATDVEQKEGHATNVEQNGETFKSVPNVVTHQTESDGQGAVNQQIITQTDAQVENISTSTVGHTMGSDEPVVPPDENSNHSATVEEDQQMPPEQLTAEEEERDQKLRASRATFLQHLPCFKLQRNSNNAGDNVNAIPRCRECRRRNVTSQHPPVDVYCRFYEFRRLQYSEDGELLVAGFPNPYTDPTPEDVVIWQPDKETEPTAGWMDIQVCRYILLHAGDQFCYLWRQEAEALKLHENSNTTIAWKKVVQGIREICDVCDTTLFNFHWTCSKCGFGVCLDCFKDRKEQRSCRKRRAGDKPQRGHDEFHWMLCTATTPHHLKHELRELMLTQIIAGDALNVLGRLLHDIRALWQVPQVCGCMLSKQQLPADSELSALIQDMIKESQLKQQTSASSLATEETLRKQARMEQLHAKKLEFARAKGIDYVPGRQWTKQTLGKDPITTAFDNFKHINFLRKGLAGLRRFLPPRAMTLAHSTLLAPGVPHEWLCDGKLLRLTDATHPDNRILFQEVWKCGQPVMISEVERSLNLDLWRPEAFCRDFGDKPNDLINCLNGNLVPNQPMRHFWEGFQCIRKRLLDHNGKPMLLKLKDWPPGDDFAEILPTRYADLMKGLPMPEYTLRTGNLNIASCLPKMFVPPDLGPKMYNAYGSALHPDKGTTNLHLDISDAANIMVYVGIPQDSDSKSQLVATQRAIALGGCDYITRARNQLPNVVPGALWHIFPARDADKIRDLLNRVTLEKGFRLEPDHDPIHDQNWYLDDKLRARLFKEYGVEGYPIVQCLGDAVFIPAGAPHQVQNLHNCIKVAEDFVSPENITHCYHLTHEFRRLSHSHTNHEDKLQIKNIIYHAIKDCCHILVRALDQRIDAELERQEQQYAKLKLRACDSVEFISKFATEN